MVNENSDRSLPGEQVRRIVDYPAQPVLSRWRRVLSPLQAATAGHVFPGANSCRDITGFPAGIFQYNRLSNSRYEKIGLHAPVGCGTGVILPVLYVMIR